MAQGSPARLSAPEGRKFAFTLAAAFGVLAAVLWWRERQTVSTVFGAVAVAFALAGLVLPGHLGPVYRG